jgi:4-amino-4-deoxy-L-arabinose transferase-like glycosyltransferase
MATLLVGLVVALKRGWKIERIALLFLCAGLVALAIVLVIIAFENKVSGPLLIPAALSIGSCSGAAAVAIARILRSRT